MSSDRGCCILYPAQKKGLQDNHWVDNSRERTIFLCGWQEALLAMVDKPPDATTGHGDLLVADQVDLEETGCGLNDGSQRRHS